VGEDDSGQGLPSGTVTFLFTDIEGSTPLWDAHPAAMREALARHDEIVRKAIDAADGHIFSTGGDRFGAVFTRAGNAVAAAAGRNAI
jgi:class 3 adenylate cyclase